MKKYYLLVAMVLMGMFSIKAQQDAQYTQYMYNTMSVNPGYTGSRGALSTTLLYRTQWMGLEGAPETLTFNVHAPIKKTKVGLGLSVIHDKIGEGAVQETNFDIDFSYTLPLSDNADLSLGLKAGGHLLNIDFTALRQFDPEFTASDNIDNKFSPNIGVGAYIHTDKFYLGLSAPNLLETEHFDNTNTSSSTATERVNVYFITGYVFDLSGNVKFKPALLTKMVSGAPLQLDISGNFMFNDKFILGAAYRWDAAVSALAGFQVSDQLLLGMAYDWETTDLGNTAINDGSLEFLLRFELIKNVKKTVAPRFF